MYISECHIYIKTKAYKRSDRTRVFQKTINKNDDKNRIQHYVLTKQDSAYNVSSSLFFFSKVRLPISMKRLCAWSSQSRFCFLHLQSDKETYSCIVFLCAAVLVILHVKRRKRGSEAREKPRCRGVKCGPGLKQQGHCPRSVYTPQPRVPLTHFPYAASREGEGKRAHIKRDKMTT